MLSQVMSQADLTIFPKISLVLFLLVYVIAVLWVMHPSRKKINNQVAQSILDDDTNQGKLYE